MNCSLVLELKLAFTDYSITGKKLVPLIVWKIIRYWNKIYTKLFLGELQQETKEAMYFPLNRA